MTTGAKTPVKALRRTLTSAAELRAATVDWLNGAIHALPQYPSRCDIDDAPHLREALIALNHAGVLTMCSQAGSRNYRDPLGRRWDDHAAIDGLADDATCEWIAEALPGHLCAIIWKPNPGPAGAAGRIPMTFLDDEVLTCFGQLTGDDIKDEYFHGCRPELITELCSLNPVTIWDPKIGRNTMWKRLRVAAERRATAES